MWLNILHRVHVKQDNGIDLCRTGHYKAPSNTFINIFAVAPIPATGPVFLRLESWQWDSNKISLFDYVRVPAEIPMPEATGMLS